MRTSILSKLSFLLLAVFIVSACSPVKLSSIEKRRYRDGYYMQVKHKAPKADVPKSEALVINSDASEPEEVATSSSSSAKKTHNKSELKKVKTVLKDLKKGQNREQFVATVNELADKAVLFDTHKNQASFPKHKRETKNRDTLNSAGPQTFGTGESAIVLLIVLALLLILLMGDVLVAILIAVVLALLIIWLLRELELID